MNKEQEENIEKYGKDCCGKRRLTRKGLNYALYPKRKFEVVYDTSPVMPSLETYTLWECENCKYIAFHKGSGECFKVLQNPDGAQAHSNHRTDFENIRDEERVLMYPSITCDKYFEPVTAIRRDDVFIFDKPSHSEQKFTAYLIKDLKENFESYKFPSGVKRE